MAEPSTEEMEWVGELSIPRELPATLARDYCAVGALFQFARVPWAVPQGDDWLVGDLRYDREPELGFAEIEVGPATRLPEPTDRRGCRRDRICWTTGDRARRARQDGRKCP